MAKPVLVVVDDEEASRQALARELEARYGAHYRIVSSVSPEEALAGLEQLRAEGADVPLVLADQWMPGMTGAQFLGRVRELYPTARRILLVFWGDQSAAIPQAAALGQIDFYVFKPSWPPDEQFHRAVTESLEAWWRLRGGQFATVTVIGEEPSGRVHEIRDLLTRNNIPFGFTRADSPEGQAVSQRLGVRSSSGPVVALHTGEVLVDPTNAQVAKALGVDVRPPAAHYDVVIVGAGPAGLAAAVYLAADWTQPREPTCSNPAHPGCSRSATSGTARSSGSHPPSGTAPSPSASCTSTWRRCWA
jgi:thioredoxin reductase (NADPH)